VFHYVEVESGTKHKLLPEAVSGQSGERTSLLYLVLELGMQGYSTSLFYKPQDRDFYTFGQILSLLLNTSEM